MKNTDHTSDSNNGMHELTADALARNPRERFECVCCGKFLKNPATIKWVEMSIDGTYYKMDSTALAEENSQGYFPMGAACYRAAKPI